MSIVSVQQIYSQLPQAQDNEIDLIGLIENLWRAKKVSLLCILVATVVAALYLMLTPNTYKASVQIHAPSTSTLTAINNTNISSITPEIAFASFLNILESDSHKKQLIEQEQATLAALYGIDEKGVKLENISISNLYEILYPSIKLEDSAKPKIYSISVEGFDRNMAKRLLESNLSIATKTLTEQWEQEFLQIKHANLKKLTTELARLTAVVQDRRQNTIIQLMEEAQLKLKKLNDELLARKSYVISRRNNRIVKLEEAIKVAKRLNISQPLTSTTQSISQHEEADANRQDRQALYFRGYNLLSAELESLKQLPNNEFLDVKIIELESELQVLQKNRDIEVLKLRESDIPFNEELQTLKEDIQLLKMTEFPKAFAIDFNSAPAIAPKGAFKPRKALTLVVAVFAGLAIGLLISMLRIAYRNAKKAEDIETPPKRASL